MLTLACAATRLGAELEGLGALGGGEGGFGSLAETIMHQLLSKDVLYQPMKEIGSRYPDWLAQHKYVPCPCEVSLWLLACPA